MKTEDIKLFHQIAESGSMAKVANILGLPKSNLSRRIQALEEQLNVALFHRQNRALTLTDKGRQFYQNTRPLISQLQVAIDEVMDSGTDELSGSLRVQMLPYTSKIDIKAKVFGFIERHPKVMVEIKVSGEHENIKEEQIDVAFRVGDKQDDSTLIARPYMSVSIAYYASPAYIERWGEPCDYDELRHHNFCRYRFPSGEIYNEMPKGQSGGKVAVSGNVLTNNPHVMKELAIEGKAIVFLPENMVADDVAEGNLVKLFPDKPGFLGTEWVVYSSRRHLSAVARAFVDYLFEIKPS